MSRSYKKYPLCRVEKRIDNNRNANRQLRRKKLEKIPKGNWYRKYNNYPKTWTSYWTKEQAIQDYYSDDWIQQKYTLEAWLQYWESCVRRK